MDIKYTWIKSTVPNLDDNEWHWPEYIKCHLVTPHGDIGLGHQVIRSNGSRPLPEPMLTYHQGVLRHSLKSNMIPMVNIYHIDGSAPASTELCLLSVGHTPPECLLLELPNRYPVIYSSDWVQPLLIKATWRFYLGHWCAAFRWVPMIVIPQVR